MSKVALWKKKMDEYYANVNKVELQRDLGNAGFTTLDATVELYSSLNVLALHEVAVAVEGKDANRDQDKHVTSAMSYAL